LRDFYRPLRIGALFSELFPGEVFDINSSPDRVHQFLRRARRSLRAHKLPLKIVETHAFYSLEITGNISFRLPRDHQSVDHMHLHFMALRKAFADGRRFSAREAQTKLGLSKTTTFRLLSWAKEQKKIDLYADIKGNRFQISIESMTFSDSEFTSSNTAA
jgi:hypothetical protein